MPSTNPSPWLVLPKWQQPDQTKKSIPTQVRPVSRPGTLAPERDIEPGVHAIYIFAPNAEWVQFLRWVSKWSGAWSAFLAVFGPYANSTNNKFEFSFPASHKHGSTWLPRKGFDEKKKALWFLIEAKPRKVTK